MRFSKRKCLLSGKGRQALEKNLQYLFFNGLKNNMYKKTWIDDAVDLYDFIWKEGTNLCGFHVNQELMEDFANGGHMFEEMKVAILEKFPTPESALQAFHSPLTN